MGPWPDLADFPFELYETYERIDVSGKPKIFGIFGASRGSAEIFDFLSELTLNPRKNGHFWAK